MSDGNNEWGTGVIEVTKKYTRMAMIGFCIMNTMKILNVNLAKILVCTPRLFLLEKISNFVGYIC